MSRELATAREELEQKGRDLQIDTLSEDEQNFDKLFRKISPISFEHFKRIEGNELEAELILKAYEYYQQKISMVEDIKNQLKTKKFSQKDYCTYIGKSVKTLLNQKEKYANLLQFIKVLQERYESETISILKTYSTKSKVNDDEEIIDNATAILTTELIQEKNENSLLKEKIKEIDSLLDNNYTDIDSLKNAISNIIKQVGDL